MAPAAASSPVVGAGVAVPGLTVDFTGQSRSNPPTIGAYDVPASGSSPTPPPVTPTPPPTPPPSAQWTKVANENDIVNVPAGTTVRFGFAANWSQSITFTVATTFTATNSFFGGDPLPRSSSKKWTHSVPVPASPPELRLRPQQWTKVANENDVVNVPAGTTVRFGFAPNWSQSITFTAATTFTATTASLAEIHTQISSKKWTHSVPVPASPPELRLRPHRHGPKLPMRTTSSTFRPAQPYASASRRTGANQ